MSIKKRNDGNKKFKEKNYEESLSLYTQSIFTAKGNDLSLPLAYSHRSLVLQIMNYTLESIQNINLALEAGFPRNKVQEMILKNVRCLIRLGHFEKAQIYLENVLKESFARGILVESNY